jgi:hypothetical protein
VLRSHVEAGIHSEDELYLRRRLDEELEWLARQELRVEIGSDVPNDVPEEAQQYFKRLVWESPAFAQYLNTYLYFGIRFAAWRLGDPPPPSIWFARRYSFSLPLEQRRTPGHRIWSCLGGPRLT